ncbi:MAG: hypothetical protein ACPL7O_04440 [Armatimonadota bacterium]
MLKGTQGKVIVGLLILTVVVGAVLAITIKPRTASAQMPPSMADEVPPPDMVPPPPDGQEPPQPGRMPGAMPNRSNRTPGSPSQMFTSVGRIGYSGTPAIAASGEYVYVVQGNTLYQFSARTLKLVNKAELTSTQSKPNNNLLPDRSVLPQ